MLNCFRDWFRSDSPSGGGPPENRRHCNIANNDLQVFSFVYHNGELLSQLDRPEGRKSCYQIDLRGELCYPLAQFLQHPKHSPLSK